MSALELLDVMLPVAREAQDAALGAQVGALLVELGRQPDVHTPCFERFTKPHWGLCLRVLGSAAAVTNARTWVEAVLAAAPLGQESAGWTTSHAAHDDKWLGRWATWLRLREVHAHDSVGALAALRAEAASRLGRSRSEASLLRIEVLLDGLGLQAATRREFYRQGYAWAFESGRWDDGMQAALTTRYESEGEALRAALRSAGARLTACAGEDATLAAHWLDGVRGALDGVALESDAERLELALCAARGHVNRWGVHAVQAAVTCWLVARAWRDLEARQP